MVAFVIIYISPSELSLIFHLFMLSVHLWITMSRRPSSNQRFFMVHNSQGFHHQTRERRRFLWAFHISATFLHLPQLHSLFHCVCVTAQTPQPVVHFRAYLLCCIPLLWPISYDLELKPSESFVCLTLPCRCFNENIYSRAHSSNVH